MNASADLAIRMRRAVFNRALADADLEAIGPLLARDVVMMTGTDSAILAGRKAQLLAWKREFTAARRTIYVRTPEVVTGSDVAPVAFEQGRWQGADDGGRVLASGSYAAKWRRIGPDWVIEAEIFVTLA